jgi:hypothetical protein
MADNQPSGQSTGSFESSPPRGVDVEDEPSHTGQTPDLDATDTSDSLDNMPTEGAMMTDLDNDVDQDVTMQDIDQSLDYRQFSPGFSDDEDSGQAFEHDWSSRQAKRQAIKAAKSKKSPRRDDDADLEPRVRTKKPRPSLFGSTHADISEGEQADVSSAPATPGHVIGNRMSSLNLDAEEADDETNARNVSNGFGLACSDIGSVHDSPVPSDDEFTIPPDPLVSQNSHVSQSIASNSFSSLVMSCARISIAKRQSPMWIPTSLATGILTSRQRRDKRKLSARG